MLRFNHPEELAAYIRSLERGLVVFDGVLGAGKNYMAEIMSERVPCSSFDTDDFVVPMQRKYVGALQVDALRDRIEEAFATSPIVVLGGLCGRQVVERAKLSAAAFVWIERSSADLTSGWLRQEVEAYIAACDPRDQADAIYLND
jgi:hypothetical protein